MTEEREWSHPWTNVYGLARTLLALGTLLTLCAHDAGMLFRPLGETTEVMHLNPLSRLSLYTLFGPDRLEAARALSIAILLVVASGWRPRWTGVAHWWVSFSFVQASFVLEGGDQLTSILTLLLIPVTLSDPRRWHWSAAGAPLGRGARFAALAGGSVWLAFRVQMAAVYLHAAVGKMAVREWMDGTALYYWFTNPLFGAPPWLEPLAVGVVSTPAVTALTWGVILLELLLFAGLVVDRRHRGRLLVAGLAFHFGIVLVHGLVSFFCAMAAGLILYFRAPEDAFRLPARVPVPARRRTVGPGLRIVPRGLPRPAAAVGAAPEWAAPRSPGAEPPL